MHKLHKEKTPAKKRGFSFCLLKGCRTLFLKKTWKVEVGLSRFSGTRKTSLFFKSKKVKLKLDTPGQEVVENG
jgi:hypothetical protein